MFCDLVGSTAMSAQLDPEDLRAIISACPLHLDGLVFRLSSRRRQASNPVRELCS
jgi:class 3 adenylate cyclase